MHRRAPYIFAVFYHLFSSDNWWFLLQVRKRPLNKKEIAKKEEDIITIELNSNSLTVHETKLKVRTCWFILFIVICMMSISRCVFSSTPPLSLPQSSWEYADVFLMVMNLF